MVPTGRGVALIEPPAETTGGESGPISGYRFGPFQLDAAGRILERDGERVALTPKVIDTLLVLVANAGQLVTKEALIQSVWPDVTVVDSGLTRNISVLRKTLEAGVAEGTYVETIPRRGYRFVAPVEPIAAKPEESTPPVERPTIAVRRFPIWAVASLSILTAAGIGCLFAFSQGPNVSRSREAQEPMVRIGEHLLYKLSPSETARALGYFERAAARNPRSAGAHAGISMALVRLSGLGSLGTEVLSRASVAAQRAVELDPTSAAARCARGEALFCVDWRFNEAETEFRRALELQPESVQTRYSYSVLKVAMGQLSEARRLVEEALRLDPASPALGAQYCKLFYYDRDFERAVLECRKVLDREPGYALASYYLALSLAFQGRTAEATQALQDTRLAADVVATDHTWVSLRAGNRAAAEGRLETFRDLIRKGRMQRSAKLLLTAALGLRDEAFEAVDAAVEAHAPEMLTLLIDPRLDAIRQDHRYKDAVRRMGLSQAIGLQER
jgi:DNA-binding winged helix-turn-helix (wHTH) protein/tetratricopeptide (TPR) repeat protein